MSDFPERQPIKLSAEESQAVLDWAASAAILSVMAHHLVPQTTLEDQLSVKVWLEHIMEGMYDNMPECIKDYAHELAYENLLWAQKTENEVSEFIDEIDRYSSEGE